MHFMFDLVLNVSFLLLLLVKLQWNFVHIFAGFACKT